MKKRIVTIMLAGVLGASVFAMAGCGNQTQQTQETTTDSSSNAASSDAATGDAEVEGPTSDEIAAGTMEAIQALLDEAAATLVIPESTGDPTYLTGAWTVTGMEDADGNYMTLEEYADANGMDASALETYYTFAEDGTLTMVTASLADITTPGVYGFYDDGTVVITVASSDGTNTTTMDISAYYDEENDIVEIYDANTGYTSYLVHAE